MTTFRLDDNVLRRMVQIMQEGMLTGTDVADHMRMIRLQSSNEETDVLILTEDYATLVSGQHEAMLQEVKDISS
jgi:hypothetical protein